MGRIAIIFAVFFCTFLLIGVGCVEKNGNMGNTIKNDIAEANNAFAFDMYDNITSSENVLFSPYSIFTAMAICYDGAEGLTKEQIADVFYYPLSKQVLATTSKEIIDTLNSNSVEYDMYTANALWVQNDYPLSSQFVDNAKKYYGGKVSSLDLVAKPAQSADIINKWVEKRTNNKIKDLVSEKEISPETRLIITNAIYFKGTWANEFDPQDTRKELFYLSDGEEISVEMMYRTYNFNYGENANERIIELPYKGLDLSMYIILPQENNISVLENNLSLSDYNELKSGMSPATDVNLWLPKFTFDTKYMLSEQLYDMGAEDAFSDSANFSGIFDAEKVPPGHGLKIDEVIHQAFIDVQEEGTEAAGATAVVMADTAAPSEPVEIVEFKVDHPFMFFIEDKRTGCILFMGKVEVPEYA